MLSKDLVEVSFLKEGPGVWKFANRQCRGTLFHYDVDDYNYKMRNQWEFLVQLPDAWTKGNYINVRPSFVPNRKIWAGLERNAITFQRATLGRHRGKVYAKLNIADKSGRKTKITLKHGDKASIPKWFDQFSIVRKSRVTTSLANDGEHLVAIVDRDDHASMIRLFVALKPWVLDAGYDPKEARAALLRRRRRSAAAADLKGKAVAITGRLGLGTRRDVFDRLERMGALPKLHTTGITDFLVVGAHAFGADLVKIKIAVKLGIPMLSESEFRRKYSI